MTILDFVPRWVFLLFFVGAVLNGCRLSIEVERARSVAADLRTEIADANARAADQARDLQRKVSEAQNEARSREIHLRAAAAAAGNAADGLQRDLDAARDQLANATRDAAIERAAAVGAVLAECSRRYQELAAAADRHVSDLRTLIEAWPR